MSPLVLLLTTAGLLASACVGEDIPNAGPDGRRRVDAAPLPVCRLDGGVGVTCPNDPSPCPGHCNDKGYCEIDCGFGPEIKIPAATVVMGADEADRTRWYSPTNRFLNEYRQALNEESPKHLATISKPYLIDRYEVTEGHYRACVEAKHCPKRAIASSCFADGEVASWFPELAGDHPATCLTYDAAETYCRWKGARMPTEAEWTLAGRGPAALVSGGCETTDDLAAGDGRCNERPYPWGELNPVAYPEGDHSRANVDYQRGDGRDSPFFYDVHVTTPVGFYDGSAHGPYEIKQGVFGASYQTHDGSSIYGVHDLIGNVFEWVGEWYDPAYYAVAPRMDPRGPASGTKRLLKSCGPGIVLGFRTLTARTSEEPDGLAAVGVRCVRDLP